MEKIEKSESKPPQYTVAEKYAHLPLLVTIIPNSDPKIKPRRVNLFGKDVEIEVPATPGVPAQKRLILGATHEDLEYLFNLGHQDLIDKNY